jgi:hypothetical protein
MAAILCVPGHWKVQKIDWNGWELMIVRIKYRWTAQKRFLHFQFQKVSKKNFGRFASDKLGRPAVVMINSSRMRLNFLEFWTSPNIKHWFLRLWHEIIPFLLEFSDNLENDRRWILLTGVWKTLGQLEIKTSWYND